MLIYVRAYRREMQKWEVNMAQYIIGGLLLALAVALVVIILKQTGKDKGLSGTLAGGSDTFFGKSGGSTKDKLLFRVTVVLSILFVVLSVVLTILVSSGSI